MTDERMDEIGCSLPDEAAGWQTWAVLWELLALSLRYPDAELADAAASGQWRAAAEEVAGVLGLGLPDGWCADPLGGKGEAAGVAAGSCSGAGSSDNEAYLHALRVEATRLFVGAPDAVCPPYEGVWRAEDDGVQALLFVNPHSMEVERFMRSCGLGRPAGTNEPLDHVATECELLELLALRAAGVEPPEGAPADTDLPGGSPAACYGIFLREHVRAWMPRFAERLAAEALEPLYRSAAPLLAAAVAAQ